MSEKTPSWKIVVDWNSCGGHGQCEFAAPNVFSINYDGELELNETPDDSERKAVEQAVRRCPARALAIEEL